MHSYRLYLVTDDQQDLETQVNVIKEAILGGVTMVQVREKGNDIRTFIKRAAAIKAILKDSDVPLIINDRVDVALAINADGVHLGQTDMPAKIARELLGPDKILGLSIENEQQLIEANDLPIDYIGLSAIFSTPTKTNIKKQWGIEGLKQALAASQFPVVAIGGINKDNLDIVVKTGVDGIALVSAICHSADPRQSSKVLLECIEKNQLDIT